MVRLIKQAFISHGNLIYLESFKYKKAILTSNLLFAEQKSNICLV